MRETTIFLLVLNCCTDLILSCEPETQPLQISNGVIVGRKLKSFRNHTYYAYQEIPYANPPTGNLRFKEAIEAKNWTGVLKTTQNTKVCIQFNETHPLENEDCLYLNVYTPVDPSGESELLPVWVFIHGGFFLKGDGRLMSYGPQYIMDFKVIFVTIQYRLGPLGFAYTNDNVVPGNLGLRDQNLAFKWIQKNIGYFKGDPKKVTISGESAGAASVGYHLVSPQTNGLFRAAILESGSPLCSKMFQKHPQYFTYQLAAAIDKTFTEKNSTDELLKVLMSASVDDLKLKSSLPIPEDKRNSAGIVGNTIWAPVIETNTGTGYVMNSMDEYFQQGLANNVPVLIGTNSEEEMFYVMELEGKASYYDQDSTTLINGNLNIEKSYKKEAGKEIKALYTNVSFEGNFSAFLRFMSDAKYSNGICRLADLQSTFTNVYFYIFSYDGLVPENVPKVPGAGRVGHTEEMKYLYHIENDQQLPWKCLDRKVQDVMLRLWSNFVIYMNPTPTKDLFLNQVIWTPVRPTNFSYLNINDALEMTKDPRDYKQWKNIFAKYAEEEQETF